mgnify:CR=1 FL=1
MAGTPVLQTAVKTVELLEVLARQGAEAVSLARIAEQVGWGRAATHQYLNSLVHAGWVEQDAERRYRLGGAAFVFAQSVGQHAGAPRAVVAMMEELVDALNEPISFAILHRDEALIVERREPQRSLIYRNLERHLDLTTASGQVLLAFDDRTRAYWRPEYTLLAEEVRKKGYGEIRNQEWMGDAVEAFAVPIMNGEQCLGALSVIAPVGRMPVDRAIAELFAARKKAEANIAGSG